jgi:probable rRNA maturation factor
MLSIRTTARSHLPSLPYEAIARDILGEHYELSLVLCGDTLARHMNKTYRKKSYAPNVLSFPLSKRSGEIFLNGAKATREARRFETTLKKRLLLLFVHGCWHLAGLSHGKKMDAAEARIIEKYH